jgi:16S rRNA processing protein RimM
MVIMGCVGAPYGIKGSVHVQSFTKPPGNLLSYKTWYLRKNTQGIQPSPWQEVHVKNSRIHGKSLVATFVGHDTREAAAALNHSEIAVLREALPVLESNQYYWADLIGMTVITKEGTILGELQSFLETGSNDVLVVTGEKKEHLIPYVPQDYVLQIDIEARMIQVDWDPEF